MFAGLAGGLDEVIFRDGAAAATATGRLRRNGAVLSFHDGTAARTLDMIAVAQTISAVKTYTATIEAGKGADIASATALTLGTDGNLFHVTGTTTITSISTKTAGTRITLVFDGALLLTHNATTLILPNAVDLTTVAGDVLEFRSEGSGNWRCVAWRLTTAALNRKGTDIASAAALNLGQDGDAFHVTGTTAITSIETRPAGFVLTLVFDGALTLTYNATTLILQGSVNLTTAAGDVITLLSEGSGNWREKSRRLAATAATTGLPRSYLVGLGLANNGVDAVNDIDVAVGTTRNSTNADDMTLASTLTKQLDAAWAVGTNAGGLDTGTIANTTYHVWLIKRSDTGVVDALFSTSATAPTMPASYDYRRRIGSIIRTAAAIVLFTQLGDEFLRSTPVNDINTTNPGTAAVLATLSVPTGLQVRANVSANAVDVTPLGSDFLLESPDQTDIVPIVGGHLITGSSSVRSSTFALIRTNTSAQIRYRAGASDANYVVRISTHGWIDTRGRDS